MTRTASILTRWAGSNRAWWLPGPPPSAGEVVAFAAFVLVLVAVTEAVRLWRAYEAAEA